jgi:Secretion system C-terminal sorting domain
MKKITLLVFLMVFSLGFSQNTVTVNGSATWRAWATWGPATGNAASDYGGNAWGLGDLKTFANTFNNSISLYPNFSAYGNGTNPYWVNGAIGSKIFEGSSYVESAALAGSSLTFTAKVASYTLDAGYTAEAFIKAIDPTNNYSTVIDIRTPLVAGQTFTISTAGTIPAGLLVQYGFAIKGLNANPAQEAALGKVVVGPAGVGVPIVQMNLPVTFDDTAIDYNLLGFGGADNSTVLTDPTLSTNKVVRVIKSATADSFAGTTITGLAETGFSSKIPFTVSATKMSVRIWSPNAGIKVRLKIEDHTNSAINCETEATVTTASKWQTLEFDFANKVAGTPDLDITKNYDKATIFFNFGVAGSVAGLKTYYFDDVKFISVLSTDKFDTSNILIYPNPIQNTLTIEANAEIQRVSVYNVLGQELISANPKSNTAILQTNELQKGMYIVTTKINDNISSSKIVKE